MEIIFIIVWLYFSIFFHEMGHFFVAKIFDFNPYLVVVGNGKTVTKINFFNSLIEFRQLPSGGITYISNLNLDRIKLKLALMYLAGPLVNCFFCLLFSLIHTQYILNYSDTIFVSVTGILIYIEFLTFVSNLIPLEVHQYRRNLSNDGKNIIDALTKSNQQFIQKLLGLTRYTNNQNTCSSNLLNNDLKAIQKFFQAHAAFNRKSFDEVIELLEPMLYDNNIITRDKVYIIDTLASIVINYGETKYLVQADSWSAQGLALAGDIKTIQGTRGSILIELGRYHEGKEMLLPLTEAGNEAIDIAVSCCYIAKADYFLGNEDKVKGWLNKAEKIGAGHQIVLRIQKELNCLLDREKK
jgi:hypothetical protein